MRFDILASKLPSIDGTERLHRHSARLARRSDSVDDFAHADANGSEEAYKKKKHTQVQLGGGGYDVQHLYAASLIQPKFDDDMPRGKNGEKVENGAMLVSTYCEARGACRGS